MANSRRHPLRVGQLRQDPRQPKRVVEVLALCRGRKGGGARITDVVVKDTRDGHDKTLPPGVLLRWHLVPPGSVEMPESPLSAMEAVLFGDVREEPSNRRGEACAPRQVKVLQVEGPEPDDRALVENVATGRPSRIKVGTLARWALVSRRES